MRKLCLPLIAAVLAVTFSACDQSVQNPTAPQLTAEGALLTHGAPHETEYDPHTPSQIVACNLVDQAIAKIPHGNGDGIVTEDETGPGGWRFNGGGRSFVTFNQSWTGALYTSNAGRSNTGANTGIINDYPAFLDLPQATQEDQLVFKKNSGEIILGGGAAFQLPGQDNGQVRISMQFVDTENGDRIYEGCAKTPQLTNFGFTVKEGGDFVQQEYFKAWARTNADYEVLEYEWTEISTFKNTDPGAE